MDAALDATDDRNGSRLCKNVHARERRRTVFSVVFSRLWSPAFLFFKLTVSGRHFYWQIQLQSFHKAWVISGHRVAFGAASGLPPKADVASAFGARPRGGGIVRGLFGIGNTR